MVSIDPAANLPWRQRFRLRRRKWEHRGRNFFLYLLRKLLLRQGTEGRGSEPKIESKDREAIRKVLIVRTGRAIGDAVMSLVLVPEGRRLFPQARIDLLFRDNVSPLFSEGSGADALLELHPRFLHWPLATWKLFRFLRKNRYDLVIACDTPLKSSLTTLCLVLWTGARWRVGFDNEESRPFLNLRVTPQERAPMVTSLLRLLSPFGETKKMAFPQLAPSARFSSKVESILGPRRSPTMIFVPSHWRKSWPLNAFIRLASALTARQHPVVLAFGLGDRRVMETEIQEWVQKSEGWGQVLAPQNLLFFAAILARCRLFISNDCGPYHIAVSVGTPCLGIFLTREAKEDFGYERENSLAAIHHPEQVELEKMALEAAFGLLRLHSKAN